MYSSSLNPWKAIAFSSAIISPPTLADAGKNRIEDNSFLIEEAYNQGAGVVQYIQAYQYSHETREWIYTFTQEMPVFDQTHQFSYVIPIAHVEDSNGEAGIGDILINYRYQLIANETLAVAPRLSLIAPTGDEDKGLGMGTTGYQVNLPVSILLNDRWITHWNLGATYTPDVSDGIHRKQNLTGYSYGGSIIYLQSENFNWMLEYVKTSSDTFTENGDKTKDDAAYINPGFRFAKNYSSGLQIVSGLSFPLGVGDSKDDNGVLVYLSFEK
ncbi:MAG TPA: hypothetical protein VN030_14500 [Cellvibrio sp.]|nr:hypothetical protein [Cellvibrio sp.]